jgi:hypothetical protein
MMMMWHDVNERVFGEFESNLNGITFCEILLETVDVSFSRERERSKRCRWVLGERESVRGVGGGVLGSPLARRAKRFTERERERERE